jgi:hypothetical protein
MTANWNVRRLIEALSHQTPQGAEGKHENPQKSQPVK